MTSSMEYYINQDVINEIVESFKSNLHRPDLQAILTNYVILLENCLRLTVDKMNNNPEAVERYKTEVKHHVDMFDHLIDKLFDLRCVYGIENPTWAGELVADILADEELVLSRPKTE